jgi:hypothetical protein
MEAVLEFGEELRNVQERESGPTKCWPKVTARDVTLEKDLLVPEAVLEFGSDQRETCGAAVPQSR